MASISSLLNAAAGKMKDPHTDPASMSPRHDEAATDPKDGSYKDVD
jgi:hypothetical protein